VFPDRERRVDTPNELHGRLCEDVEVSNRPWLKDKGAHLTSSASRSRDSSKPIGRPSARLLQREPNLPQRASRTASTSRLRSRNRQNWDLKTAIAGVVMGRSTFLLAATLHRRAATRKGSRRRQDQGLRPPTALWPTSVNIRPTATRSAPRTTSCTYGSARACKTLASPRLTFWPKVRSLNVFLKRLVQGLRIAL